MSSVIIMLVHIGRTSGGHCSGIVVSMLSPNRDFDLISGKNSSETSPGLYYRILQYDELACQVLAFTNS
jgi:hypothetical protein